MTARTDGPAAGGAGTAEDGLRAAYEARAAAAAERAEGLARRAWRISWARLAAFSAAAACFASPGGRALHPGWLLAGAAAAAAFAALVGAYRRASAAQRREEARAALNRQSADRMARAWDRVPVPRAPAGCAEGATARDLGLFGRASLFHLLGGHATPYGRRTLAGWLLRPADPGEVRARQAAVRALAPERDAREELRLEAHALAAAPADAEPFLRWAEGEPWLARRPWMTGAARVLTAAFVLAAGASLAGVTRAPLWAPLALVNAVFGLATMGRLHRVFARVEARQEEVGAYRGLLRRVESLPGDAPRLARIRGAVAGADAGVGRLEALVGWAEARRSPAFHILLQALFLWDVHVLHALERWQLRTGPRVRGWLEAMGEAEALAALAALAHDHPDWAFPEIAAGGAVQARALGHPLIPTGARVANDVEVGPPGRFLLVTGSNMSGKSTLMRAVGTNAVLALAGAPVCAAALRLPPVRLGTSFVVEDSLEDGVSYFMAELRRLKEVVDAAAAEGPPLLFLLDEVLRGTNSAERRIAVRGVVRRLLESGAMGAVSTHDLALAEAEGLAGHCRPVHFRETLHEGGDGPPMTFDYRMREGVAPTSNALVLLRMVGLGEPEPAPGGDGVRDGNGPRGGEGTQDADDRPRPRIEAPVRT